MGGRVRYEGGTAPVAFRLPEPARRLLDYCVLRSGAESVSDYLRELVEQHLINQGFELTPGRTARLPLPSDAAAQWKELDRGPEPG